MEYEHSGQFHELMHDGRFGCLLTLLAQILTVDLVRVEHVVQRSAKSRLDTQTLCHERVESYRRVPAFAACDHGLHQPCEDRINYARVEPIVVRADLLHRLLRV